MADFVNLDEEMLALVRYAFPQARSGREEVFRQALKFSTPYTIKNKGKLQSMLLSLDYDLFWKEKTAKMAGVGLVASYPEARGQGHIRQLMTEMLTTEYAKGTELSYLSPFSYAFYRKFGYEYCFKYWQYVVQMCDWPQGTAGDTERLSFEQALPEMKTIHEREASFADVKRTDLQWAYHFQTRYQPYFALTEDGYLIYEYKGTSFVILELLALTEAARERLYGFVAAHASGFDKVYWSVPGETGLEEKMAEPRRANIQLCPHMMARIVNLSAFFKLNGEPDFPVEISDSVLPQNNGVYGPTGQPQQLTIGQFTAKILTENKAILRESF